MPVSADIALPPLSDHRCFLIYPLNGCRFPPQPSMTLADLDEQGWLDPGQLASINDKRRTAPLWEAGSLNPGEDFFPYIQQLLGGGESLADPNTIIYHRSDHLQKLLQGSRLSYPRDLPKAQRQRLPLLLPLSSSARRRIARQYPEWGGDALELDILDLHQIAFRTRQGFLVVELRFTAASLQQLPPALLVEGLNSLCRFNQLVNFAIKLVMIKYKLVFCFG